MTASAVTFKAIARSLTVVGNFKDISLGIAEKGCGTTCSGDSDKVVCTQGWLMSLFATE